MTFLSSSWVVLQISMALRNYCSRDSISPCWNVIPLWRQWWSSMIVQSRVQRIQKSLTRTWPRVWDSEKVWQKLWKTATHLQIAGCQFLIKSLRCLLDRPRLEWNNSHQCTSSGWGRSSCFGDEPKTHPLALPRDFSAPFSAPKFSPPTYLRPPTSLTSFPAHSISKA